MNFFLQMRESVIDFKFYREIKDNKFGRSFTYLLLLFLIIYFINGTKTFVVLRAGVDELVSQVNNNVPEFKLENGEFSFEGKMPYYISNNANEVFAIDTTGQLTEKALEGVHTGMLVTRDKLFVKQNTGELRVFSLKEFVGITLTKSDVLNFLPKLSWIVLIFIVFGFIFVFGWKLLNAVILALIGLIINAVMKADMKYNNLLNISIYALTLPLLLQLAVDLSGIAVPMFWLIYWTISIVYVAMAVKNCKDRMEEDTVEDHTDMV
ncbi:MAG: DUF1189 domain-containing protein [Caulobacteraceae bacterium]